MQLVDAANVQVLQREIGLAALCTPADLRHVVELDPADSVDHRLTPFVHLCFQPSLDSAVYSCVLTVTL